MVFVHAVCTDQVTAEKAVEELVDAGFASTEIGARFLGRDEVTEVKIKHKTGVGVGTPLGLVLGLIIGVVVGSMHLTSGPFGTIGGAMVMCGALGALLGTLAGLGLWRETIEFPHTTFHKGEVMLGVNTNEARVEEATAALQRAGLDAVQLSNGPAEGVRSGAQDV